MLVEIGGTVGDIEGLPFFEAIRQLGKELPRGHAVYIHLTLLPFIPTAGELKTKPTQHSVKELRSIGIQPDILLCRCEREIPREERRKLGLFCNVRESAVIEARDVAARSTTCRSPITPPASTARCWPPSASSRRPSPTCAAGTASSNAYHNPEGEVTIAIVGKYTGLKDAYKSLIEALTHGGIANRVKRQARLDRERDLRERPTRRRSWRTCTASWCPAASASAARRARSWRRNSPASARCPISASASACRWR